MSTSAVANLLRTAFDDMKAGRLSQAEWTFRKVLQREPRNHTAIHNLGIIAYQTGRGPLAIDLLGQSATLMPNVAQYHYNLALALHEYGHYERAAASYRSAIALNPNDPMPRNNLGNVLRDHGQLEAAIASYREALRIRPDYSLATNNLATTLQQQGRIDEAASMYRALLAAEPDNATAHSNLLMCLNYDGSLDALAVFEEHRRWARRHADPLPPIDAPRGESDGRLRIGYISADFRQHSVSHFIRPVLEHHDRDRFAVTCYVNARERDAVTGALRAIGHTWREVAAMSDEQLARQVRADGIDVLIDLSGHTSRHRLLALARRPAPVQITWLGYPNTTGMSAMDYRITDDIADPPGTTESFHAEALIRLPRGFLCYRPPDDADLPPVAPMEHRPHATFVSFNNFAKVTPPLVATWARILHELPDARLILKAQSLGDAATQKRAAEMFAGHNVDPRRLDMSGQHRSFRAHLEHYGQADVALDTFPYNGTTTTCEALLMGVPVMTLAGRTHVSRVGASLLARLDLNDLVVESEDQYVRAAVALARDRARLRELRADLRGRLMRSSLTDGAGFVRAFEAALLRAWEHRRNESPGDLPEGL